MKVIEFILRPQVLILIGGAIGYGLGGVVGIFDGLAIGYICVMLLGVLVALIHGGALPRNERNKIVAAFMKDNAELARQMFPDRTDAEVVKYVNRSINALFRKAMSDNSSQGEYSISRQNVRTASLQLRAQQTKDVGRLYWEELWAVTEEITYPQESEYDSQMT